MTKPVILPAIDIVEDQVVRLRQGRLEERTVYGHDPVETAREWEAKGARFLHVVDLDGATRGDGRNSQAIAGILKTVSIPVQVGGGIRSVESIRSWLDAGAERVVIGTKAHDATFMAGIIREFGDRIVVAVDASAGQVRVGGWLQQSETMALDMARRMEKAGVSRIMFTDIERDGTLEGPNVEAIEEIIDSVEIPVLASGGVATYHDVARLAALVPRGLEGIIVGKALYSGQLTLEEANQGLDAG